MVIFHSYVSLPEGRSNYHQHTVDGCEILHQLIDVENGGWSHDFLMCSTIPNWWCRISLAHPQYHHEKSRNHEISPSRWPIQIIHIFLGKTSMIFHGKTSFFGGIVLQNHGKSTRNPVFHPFFGGIVLENPWEIHQKSLFFILFLVIFHWKMSKARSQHRSVLRPLDGCSLLLWTCGTAMPNTGDKML